MNISLLRRYEGVIRFVICLALAIGSAILNAQYPKGIEDYSALTLFAIMMVIGFMLMIRSYSGHVALFATCILLAAHSGSNYAYNRLHSDGNAFPWIIVAVTIAGYVVWFILMQALTLGAHTREESPRTS